MRFSFNQLERLFSSHQHEFFVAALSITRNAAAAEDVVHDALLAVATLTSPPENLKAYVYRVIRNKAHQIKQAQRLDDSRLDLDYIDRLSLNEFKIEEKVFVEQALEKLATLESNQQQVLLLKFFSDLSFKDIAEIMDSPMNTVSSWYRRGQQQLQEKLDE
ncbi:MAG: RNA polymerase sigma factor [Proteobacteria bacterium]|nr:RNA polymerase sigma factor [Pseudomonadota bacterium]MDA1291713.1 RNA polymerase sigma factor [Pseudomonadota bacterium]